MIEPIERSVTVRRAPRDAFRLFTAEMGSWWPLDTHGLADHEAGEKTERLVFEERVGGRVYEVLSTGVEAEWGIVTTWDPPDRVVLDWNPSFEQRPYTEVEVTFTATDDGGTNVHLTHRLWERLGAEAGAELRADYGPGWAYVFNERFGTAAG
jgi:uncharacterized protein YndB with AHSA1/START domain